MNSVLRVEPPRYVHLHTAGIALDVYYNAEINTFLIVAESAPGATGSLNNAPGMVPSSCDC